MNDWQSTWLGRRLLPRDLSGFEITVLRTTHPAGAPPLPQLIVLLPTFDIGLARPVFVYADIAKYHVPVVRLVTT